MENSNVVSHESTAVTAVPPIIYADATLSGHTNFTPTIDIDPIASGDQPGEVGVNAFATVGAALSAAAADGITSIVVNGAGET